MDMNRLKFGNAVPLMAIYIAQKILVPVLVLILQAPLIMSIKPLEAPMVNYILFLSPIPKDGVVATEAKWNKRARVD